MTSLAFKPKKPKGDEPANISSPSGSKTQFPSLRLNGDQAAKAGLGKCAIGDTYEITVRIKARRLGGNEYEMDESDKPPAEFDVIAADKPIEIAEGGDGSDEAAEEKAGMKHKGSRIKTPKDSGFKEAYDA